MALKHWILPNEQEQPRLGMLGLGTLFLNAFPAPPPTMIKLSLPRNVFFSEHVCMHNTAYIFIFSEHLCMLNAA